jgi:hypothetical protein
MHSKGVSHHSITKFNIKMCLLLWGGNVQITLLIMYTIIKLRIDLIP